MQPQVIIEVCDVFCFFRTILGSSGKLSVIGIPVGVSCGICPGAGSTGGPGRVCGEAGGK